MSDDGLKRFLRFDSSICHCGRKFLFSKSPDEAVEFVVDFQQELPDDVYLDSVTVQVTELRSGQDVTGTVFSGPVTLDQDLDGNNIAAEIRVSGETIGKRYRVKILASLDDGFSVWERNVEYSVK